MFDAATCAPVPWKNGGGVTRPLAAGVHWRLSLADITQDGGFSTFPGLQRILTIVEGQGIHLRGDAADLTARPFTPLPFEGDLSLQCTLIDGPSRAFNLMFDPKGLQAWVRVLEPGEINADTDGILFVVHGQVEIEGGVALTSGQGDNLPSGTRAQVQPETCALWVAFI